MAVILIFITICWGYMQPANHTPLIPPNEGQLGRFGWSGILAGAAVIFFAYIGFDAVSTAAQEAEIPGAICPSSTIANSKSRLRWPWRWSAFRAHGRHWR